MARGKYVVKTGSSGLYRFNLYASNGRVVATSRSFPSAQACLRGMEALRAACGTAWYRRASPAVWKSGRICGMSFRCSP